MMIQGLPPQFSATPVRPQMSAQPKFGENEKLAQCPEDLILEYRGKIYVNHNPHIDGDDTVMLKPVANREIALQEARELFKKFQEMGIIPKPKKWGFL